MRPRGIITGIAAGLVALLALTIIFGSWYTIDQTQRGVLLRNGAFVGVIQPGLGFKLPWVDTVYKIDMQTHTKTYGHDKATNKSTMEAYSADQQPAFLRVSVTLHVSPDKVAEVYERFGGDYEAAIGRLITPPTYAYSKVVFGQYTAQRAITERGKLNADVAKSLTQAIAYDPVFTIDSVQVEDIAFSGEYIKSVEQRMQAEVQVSQFQQKLLQEKIQADIAVTQAQGRANSVVAEAEANAKSIKLRGNAEAEAIQARGDALNKNPTLVSLVQAERWDGKLPQTMIPGGAVPFISVSK
jgi:regulator of protease activity HflC (stomatin/prohibitin superfamily)